jgi:sugar lactone lactonase YvrE
MITTACLALPQAASALPGLLGQVGSNGSGAGQLSQPNGIAVDASGNVFVADRSNHRVTAFTAGGVFLRAFGRDVVSGNLETGFEVCNPSDTCKSGAVVDGAAGELSNPGGIAIDASGRLFVSDLHNRISEFTLEGAFVRAFGGGVDTGDPALQECTATTGCQPGIGSSGPGQLAGGEDIAIDSAGRLHVADSGNARVSVFEADGAAGFIHAMGRNVVPGGASDFETCTTSCQTGDTNGEAGSLLFPIGVGLDSSGSIYVAENVNNRISVIASPGTAPAFVHTFGLNVINGGGTGFEVCTATCKAGDPGGGLGDLVQANDVAVADGVISVADRNNHRVSQFSVTGPSPLRAFGFDVDPAGGAGFEICTGMTGCQAGDAGGAPGQIGSPNRLIVDCRGSLWVSDSFGRVQRFGEPGTALPPCLPDQQPPGTPPTCSKRTATHTGTGGADVVTGTPGPDVIVTLGGDDRVFGGGGNDLICAGDGNDRASGQAGADQVFGEGGADRLKGNAGRDRLFGQAGKDLLAGGGGRGDRCVGGGGKDRRGVRGCEVRRSLP